LYTTENNIHHNRLFISAEAFETASIFCRSCLFCEA